MLSISKILAFLLIFISVNADNYRDIIEESAHLRSRAFLSTSFTDKLYESDVTDYIPISLNDISNRIEPYNTIHVPQTSPLNSAFKITLFKFTPKPRLTLQKLFRNSYKWTKEKVFGKKSSKRYNGVQFRLLSGEREYRFRITENQLYDFKSMRQYFVMDQLRRNRHTLAMGWKMSAVEAEQNFGLPALYNGYWNAYTITIKDFVGSKFRIIFEKQKLIGDVKLLTTSLIQPIYFEHAGFFSLLYRRMHDDVYHRTSLHFALALPSKKERFVNVTLDPFIEQEPGNNALFNGNGIVIRGLNEILRFKVHQFRHFRDALFPGTHGIEIELLHLQSGLCILDKTIQEGKQFEPRTVSSGPNDLLKYQMSLTRRPYFESRARFPWGLNKVSGRMISLDVAIGIPKILPTGDYYFRISSLYHSLGGESVLYTNSFKVIDEDDLCDPTQESEPFDR